MSHTATATAPANARPIAPQPIGPGSLTWRALGDRRYFLVLPQAFVMQVAHPVIDAGVGEHSSYRSDPWGRAERSVRLLWPVIYARPDEAIRKGHELREMHRQIKGRMASGERYHALDPEAYGWVHGTGFYTSLKMYEVFDRPLAADQRQALFREWRQIGSMLGIRDQDLPRSEADYWDYFNDMIEHRLQWGPVLADLLSEDFYYQQPKPPGKLFQGLPDWLWRSSIRPAARRFELITRATLPANFRRRFDIPYSPADEQRFQRLRALLRSMARLTPTPLRYIPLARAAIRDAARHPEAYRYDGASNNGRSA